MPARVGNWWRDMADAYPGGAPFVKGSSTSKAAADSIDGATKTIQRQVERYIREQGVNGATDDEIESRLNLRHQTASARRRELVLLEVIVDSERTRKTRSGRKATVWVIKQPAPPAQGKLL